MNTLIPTDAEQKLIEAARDGLPADLRSANEAENDPAQGYGWGPERTIRAEIIYALATGARDDWPVHPKGIQLASARIEGQLDFGGAEIRCRLALVSCSIEEPIILVDATAESVSLKGSFIGGIQAERVIVRGNIALNGVKSVGNVNFSNAKISGQFLCKGASFSNLPGPALDADIAQIDGGVFLDDNFNAIGLVRFGGARISGQLKCSGSHFRAAGPQAPALMLDGLRTAVLLLDEGFTATGEVRLIGAEIGAQLTCRGGKFQNPNGFALSADGLTVNGDGFLDEKFAACGKVNVSGARISGNLACNGGKFDHLILQRAQVSGILAIKNLARPEQSRIDLTHARIGLLSDDQASWPAKGNLHINGFEYNAIAPYSPRDAESRLEWLGRTPEKGFSTQPYEQLEKVLRASGDERGAVEVYIAKRRAIREKGRMSRPARAWDWILDCAVGYGYGVWKTVLWSLAVVVVGAILFGFWFPFKQTPKTNITSAHSTTVVTASAAVRTKPAADSVRECADHVLRSFFYSLEVFLPFDGTPWRSSQPLRPRYVGDLWFYAIETWCVAEELLGWLAAGLIAAAAAGVIQK
ncbi:hypothetical protein IMX07_05190 [bacterium]|nr:hypothetical protein [bacterium]